MTHPSATDDDAAHGDPDRATQRAATDPTTPPRTLATLSKTPTLAPLVASNPNAPVELLLSLVADYPREVLDNPALPFLLLESPGLPLRMSRAAVAAMTRFEDVPLVILKQLGTSDDYAIAHMSRSHVQIAGESALTTGRTWGIAINSVMWRALSTDHEFYTCIGPATDHETDWLRLPHLYPRWFLEIFEAGDSARRQDAQHTNHIDSLAAPLRKSDFEGTSDTSAKPQPLSLATFTQLARDPTFEVRVALARRDDTPAGVRQILAHDSDVRTRHAVAIHPQTPPRLLEQMATDESYRVRYGVALNPNTPPFALQRLARDRDHQVRAMVARNPSTPERILGGLLKDDEHVRVSLARNPACPERLLLQLLRDRDDDVRCAALRRINPTARGVDLAAALADERLRVVVATNPRLPASVLMRLALTLDPTPGRCDRPLALALASNPAAPIEALDTLARISDAETQALVARHAHTTPATLVWLCANVRENAAMSLNLVRNPATPDDAVEQLAETNNYAVAQAVAARLNLPPNRRDQFYRRLLRYNLQSQHPPFTDEEYSSIRGDRPLAPYRLLRLAALASPLLAEEDYARGVVSPLWSERYVLARNPAAPRALVVALTHDGHSYVRAAARINLAARDLVDLRTHVVEVRSRQEREGRAAQPDTTTTTIRLPEEGV